MSTLKKNKKDKMTHYERISMITSVIAIIMAFIPTLIGIWNGWQEEKDIINIINSGFGYNKILHYSSDGYRGQGFLQSLNYSVTISNLSKHTVSFTGYEIHREIDNASYYYGNMVGIVKDSNDAPINFPVSIQSGESLLLTFEINPLIPTPVNMLLLEKFGVEGEFTYDEIARFLGENGRDLFGNEVNYTEYTDGTYIMTINDPQFPEYRLYLTTAKGNVVSAKISQLAQ